nr:uncharacterized protein LOC113810874 isoform X1 [Penaeus vannamei]XP_027218321.1 uncharacterized protein LOC113810874 isoform X1 [Penaeus vannamei]
MPFPAWQLVLISAVVSHEVRLEPHLQGAIGPSYSLSESSASPPPRLGQNGTVPQSHPELAKEESVASEAQGQDVPNCAVEINHATLFDRAFLCPRAESLYKLFENFKRESPNMRVKITVKKVDGPLTLQPPPNIIIALFLPNANVTRLSNGTANQFTAQALPHAPLASLVQLDLRNNPLLELEGMQWLGVLRSLTVLILRETPVTDRELPPLLARLPLLQHLDISSSGLPYLPEEAFNKNPELKHLDLSNNEFKKITLPENLIRGLTHLNISSCRLEEVSVPAAAWEERWSTPSSQGRLSTLDVSKNRLKWLPSRLVEALNIFSYVIIKDNLWNAACTRCPLYHLWQYSRRASRDVVGKEELDCFRQDVLLSCGWDNCPTECYCDDRNKTVNCTGKGLVALPTIVPSETETLVVDDNAISNLNNLASPTYCSLRHLSVKRNRVTELLLSEEGKCECHTQEYYPKTPKCFPQHLHTVSLEDNRIEGLTASDCPLLYPLHTLRMPRNKLDSLGAQVCGSLGRLRALDLAHNSIASVTSSDLATYPFLQSLNLSHNALEKLVPNFPPEFTSLDVSPNCLWRLTSEDKSLPRTPYRTEKSLEDLKLTEGDNCTTPGRPGRGGEEEEEEKRSSVCDGMKEKVFMIFISWVIITIILLYVCYVYARQGRCWSSREGTIAQENEDTSECKYSVFVVHSSHDREIVRNKIIIPLFQRGYSVAWHENVFVPGAWILENIERAVRNSQSMVVFATDNLAASRCSLQEIRRGRYEEMDREGFRIMALVTETLPRALKQELYEIVALRTHIQYSDRDYIEKICNFLPPPRPVPLQDASLPNAFSIRSQLDRFDEMRRENSK